MSGSTDIIVQNDTTAKPKWPKNSNVKLMLVRYGRMAQMGWFEHNESAIPKVSSKVVVKTERGLELGEVVGVHNYRGGTFRISPDQVEAYYGNLGDNSPVGPGGSFVRFATHEDIREQEHLVKSEVEEIESCEKHIRQMNLPMRIVDAEHLFGGERIIYYFTSEGRVDFRELVKTLAREYQTRIELRQIGARDEAKLVSDYETCGQQCCCSRYLKILEPVNMRMAKLQKATLDPSKISGHCGRLKCCLRYEDHTYMELKDKLPHRNAMVKTPKGLGRVVDVQILTQLVVVQDAVGDRKAWPVDELLPYDPSAEPLPQPVSSSQPDVAGEPAVADPAERPRDNRRNGPPRRDQERRPPRDNRPDGQRNQNDNRPRQERQDRPPRDNRTDRPERAQDNPPADGAGQPQGEARRRNKNRRKKRRGGNGGNPNNPNNGGGNTSTTPPTGE